MSVDKSLTELGLRDLRDAGNTGQGRTKDRGKRKEGRRQRGVGREGKRGGRRKGSNGSSRRNRTFTKHQHPGKQCHKPDMQ